MTEKVKVSREVADAIEFQLTRKSPEELLARIVHCNDGKWRFINRSAALNDLSISEMARILYVGYEVDETPEEKWPKRYKELLSEWSDRGHHQDNRYTTLLTIKEMAYDFGLKIEGVSA